MAKVTLNPVLEAIQGKIGDLVFKRWNDEEITAKLPNRTGIIPTPAQLAQREKFHQAVLYGKAALADPQSRQVYQDASARKGEPVFALAVGDFLNAPAIDEINLASYAGRTGDVIRIRATDDTQVQGVAVAIRTQQGDVLEQGTATWTESTATWAYTATTNLAQGQSVSIEVTATDRPGHQATRTQARS